LDVKYKAGETALADVHKKVQNKCGRDGTKIWKGCVC